MEYLNQLNYPDMPYQTNVSEPDSEFATCGTVKRAGCGLCCACMLIERLTLETLSLAACRELAVSVGANHGVGTDMKLLAPVLARRYGLVFCPSDESGDLLSCLRAGGCAVVNVGGDREGHFGTFSQGGHYILAVSAADGEVCLLDPSWTEEKYAEEPRRSRVRRCGYWLYCKPETLAEDTANRKPAYYLFRRAQDIAK